MVCWNNNSNNKSEHSVFAQYSCKSDFHFQIHKAV